MANSREERLTEMTSLIKPPAYDDAAYEQIAAAVMETERGRWFLAEYAKRNRHADTETLLEAIDKLGRAVNVRPVLIGSDVLHKQILDMARAILRAEKEIRAMHARDSRGIQFAAASETLDAVVETTEKATSAILSAAERMQEQAWTLRELGIDATVCDELDRSATEIYTACGFQDLTAQRIAKAVETLKFLDSRIRSLVEAAGLSNEISEEIEDIDATIAMEMETARTEPDIWMSEANQAEIDETFDFFVPAEKAEPTIVGADLLELEEDMPAIPARAELPPEATAELAPTKAIPAEPAVAHAEDEALFDGMAEILAEPEPAVASGPSPLESLDELPARDRLRAFR
jgi:chemotaxis regulatin CheY-phosphate phosphatase CheZ